MTAQMKRRSLVLAGMIFLVSQLALAIFIAVYTTHQVQESDRHQCGIIALSTKARPIPPAPPFDPSVDPTTEYGKDLDKYIRAKQQYDKELEAFNLRAGSELKAYSRQIGCPKS